MLNWKNKIWQNEYVDLVKLLPKDDLTSDKSLRLQSAGNSEYKFVAPKSKKSIKSIEQWPSAFLKFLAAYSEKCPKQVPAVIKHCEIVRELASRSFGLAWLTCDKQVRKYIGEVDSLGTASLWVLGNGHHLSSTPNPSQFSWETWPAECFIQK